MAVKLGKTQTFSREINTELVLNLLRNKPCSGTEIAHELLLSHATASSIIKQLLEINVIKIDETKSICGLGRKRVLYVLNPDYSLILGINISNLHASISLMDFSQKIIATTDLQIEKYSKSTIYDLALVSSKLLIENNKNNVPVKSVVIALPGRVNQKTGELVLSSQFDKELFSESHFIQKTFEKLFKDATVTLENDNNIMTYGEIYNGALKDVTNGVYFNIDYGVGGGIVLNKQIFLGDMGFAGEFGLIKHYDGKVYDHIDEFISLRVLREKAREIVGHKVSRDELFELYNSNEEVRNLVLESAKVVGNALVQIGDVYDINKFVLSGRAMNFGKDYIEEIIKSSSGLINQPEIIVSKIGKQAEVLGTISLAIEILFEEIKRKIQE